MQFSAFFRVLRQYFDIRKMNADSIVQLNIANFVLCAFGIFYVFFSLFSDLWQFSDINKRSLNLLAQYTTWSEKFRE